MNLPRLDPLSDIQHGHLDRLVHTDAIVSLRQFLENRKARHAENVLNKVETEFIIRMQECDDILQELMDTYHPAPAEAPPVEEHPKEIQDYYVGRA